MSSAAPAYSPPPAPPSPLLPLFLRGRWVHFAGIGGCGMSGLARIAQAAGAHCTGSDMHGSAITDALQREGIAVALEQHTETLPADCDLLAISAAVGGDHPEVVEASRRGVPILKYAQMVGSLMAGRTGVALAGTHGKSTTTAMLAHILLQAGLDPTFILGAACEQIGGGARAGREDMLIAEACEFDRSFHNFHPTHGVILNIEADHLDIYGSIEGVVEAFGTFAERIEPAGSLLIAHDSPHRRAVTADVRCAVETIGESPDADWQLATHHAPLATAEVELLHRGTPCCTFAPPLPGTHMAYDAAVAAVTAHRLGAGWPAIGEALSTFRGLDRRMQHLGERGGVTVVDDYGHHPTEIRATLRALREHHLSGREGEGRLICVFQPHQHARTKFLLDGFAQAFSDADQVIIPHIYFVRDTEADRKAVSAADLARRLGEGGVEAMHIDRFEDVVAHLRAHTRPGDLLAVMGAGPVWKVARGFMRP